MAACAPADEPSLLSQAQRAAAFDRAHELALGVMGEPADGFTLRAGAAGLAIACARFDGAFPGEGFGEAADRMLDQAVRALARERMRASLYQGLTGIAWTIAELGPRAGMPRLGFLESTIDPLLLEHVRAAATGSGFDLFDGLTGVGVYALRRLDAPLGRELLTAVVDALAGLATPAVPGIAWQSRIPAAWERGRWLPYRHIGLAHGAPGPIALLAAASAQGVAAETARVLLDAAVEWLLSQELPEDGDRSRFAHGAGPDFALRRARSAWCEGEPGIAAALLLAAHAVGDAGLEGRALEIACRAAARPDEHSGVVDPCICHGAAGLAHMFARMHALTGDARLLDAAQRWTERTIEMSAPENWSRSEIWAGRTGLTTGRMGTALVLLTLAGGAAAAWDQFLLVVPPSVRRGPAAPEVAPDVVRPVHASPGRAVFVDRGTPGPRQQPGHQHVRDVMTSELHTATPSTTVVEAAQIMRKTGVGWLPIVEAGDVVAVVSDRDIATRGLAPGALPGARPALELASREVVAVGSDQALEHAALAMAREQIRRLPVIEGGELVGILSLSDIVRAGEQELASMLGQAISAPAPGYAGPRSQRFRDRAHAGRVLAEALSSYRGSDDVLVLAIPRGGVPVAAEVARALGAPLDVVMARRLLAPGALERPLGAVGSEGPPVLDILAKLATGLGASEIAAIARAAQEELRARERRLRGSRGPLAVAGRTVLLVDDGIASGATVRGAVASLRRLGPARIAVAVPIAGPLARERLRPDVDEFYCARSPEEFLSVALWYEDYTEPGEDEVRGLLEGFERPLPNERTVTVAVDGGEVAATLSIPDGARAAVVIGPGSDSDRHSPRLRLIARALADSGLATMLADLVTARELAADRARGDYRWRHDTVLLGERMVAAVDWLAHEPATAELPVGCVGTSASGGAALIAAARRPERVRAVVTRGGITQLTPSEDLAAVRVPVLMIVGGDDSEVIAWNCETAAALRADAEVYVVPGADHAFHRPGGIEHVAKRAREFFADHLCPE